MSHSPINSNMIAVQPNFIPDSDFPDCEVCGRSVRALGRSRTCSTECEVVYGYHAHADRLNRREVFGEKLELRTHVRRDLVAIFAAGMR